MSSLALVPGTWAARFGLASVPLFENSDQPVSGLHHVLLDGGTGSFALSVSDDPNWDSLVSADWCWSSNLPHHVTVTAEEVTVVRWDRPNPERLTRPSVERHIDSFYKYLAADRVKSNRRVVDHMLRIFREVRSLVAHANVDDDTSVDAYLSVLARAIERARGIGSLPATGLLGHPRNDDFLRSLPEGRVEHLLDRITSSRSSESQRALFPSLAVRHAGSEIFQEAHFELVRAPGPDLFGYVGPAETRQVTRGGAHFTPPALARTVVEQTLSQITDLDERNRLAILDPACGSGAFLHEVLRALRRRRFGGHVAILGRDISRPAVSMADFVLKSALVDWSPPGGCSLDIRQGDSLSERLPNADLILMNPPFVSWSALDPEQREQLQSVLGNRLTGRVDYSMAFVSRAVHCLQKDGAMGVILPNSLLTLRAAAEWRRHLLDNVGLRFIASFGDYGLFRHALVRVAVAVFSKASSEAATKRRTTVLISQRGASSTGNALRSLRLGDERPLGGMGDRGWHIFYSDPEEFKDRSTWRLLPPRVSLALRNLVESGTAVPVRDVFRVRQGVQTGRRASFLLKEEEIVHLPAKEQRWFRRAVTNDAIHNGHISATHRVFYPYDKDGLIIKTEEQLLNELPFYSSNYLAPNRRRLEGRGAIVEADRDDWWGLSRYRSWTFDGMPRLVSKYFGRPGGFAVDWKGEYVVVQCFAWCLRDRELDRDIGYEEREEQGGLSHRDILAAYNAVMNSRVFSRILSIWSPQVAGGQFDLSPRYVNEVPIPDILRLARDGVESRVVRQLADLGGAPQLSDVQWRRRANGLVEELYGVDGIDLV